MVQINIPSSSVVDKQRRSTEASDSNCCCVLFN